MSEDISYKAHILIGIRSNGVMTVIADWPQVPKQAEVQQEIDAARNGTSPGEFHPEPLTDPDLSLSTHPTYSTGARVPACLLGKCKCPRKGTWDMFCLSAPLPLPRRLSTERARTERARTALCASYNEITAMRLGLHRRSDAAADVHAPGLQRSIGLLVGCADEDPGSDFQLPYVAWDVGHNWDAGRNDDRLLSILVFQR